MESLDPRPRAKKSKFTHPQDVPAHGGTMRSGPIPSTHRPLQERRVSSSTTRIHESTEAGQTSVKTSKRRAVSSTSQGCAPSSGEHIRDITMETPSLYTQKAYHLDTLQQLLAETKSCLPYNSIKEYLQYEDLLHSMFSFKDLKAADEQSGVSQYQNILERFVAALESQVKKQPTNTLGQGIWPSLSLKGFQTLSAAVCTLNSDQVTWYPKFGCALLAVSAPSAGQPAVSISVGLEQLSLHLVALDSWAFQIHSCPGVVSHTAQPGSHTVLFSGSIPSGAYKTFQAQVSETIKKRQNSDKKVGFQHTPAFLHAVIQDTAASITGVSRLTLPKGGFTDVGRHTGSSPRNTSWPLVKHTLLATFKMLHASVVSLDQLLFRQTLVHLDLWLLLGLVNLVSADTADSTMINRCMVMMQAFTTGAAALAADKHDVGVLPHLAEAMKQRLQAAVVQRQEAKALKLMLPASHITGELLGNWHAPTGVVPAETAVSNSATGLAAAKLRALANLGSLPAVTASQGLDDVVYQLVLLLQQATEKGHGGVRMQHALRSVEVEMFERAMLGIGGKHEYASLSEGTVDQLWNMVDWYRECLLKYKFSTAGESHWQMDMRSREVLVVWVAYCMTFEAGRHQHILLQQYGVALQFEDLRHLTLSDRAATDAALAIGSYLKQHTRVSRPLFSLRDAGSATFDMAEQFASDDSEMYSILCQEESASRVRIIKHWAKVRLQQQEARELRDKLRQLRSRQAEYQALRDGCSYYDSSYKSDRAYYQSKMNSVASEIKSTSSALSAAETPPPPVIQPLPENTATAKQWLFFLYMPPLLRQLSRGSFLAQQLLLPLPFTSYPEAQQLIKVANCNTSLTKHYNSANKDSTWYTVPHPGTGSDGKVLLYSAGSVPSRSSISPGHIDSYTSERVGVWFPDDLSPMMAWRGTGCSTDSAVGLSNGSFYDPFRPTAESTVLDSFTEKLPQQHHNMQWAMQQPYSRKAVAADRGNLAIAQQDQTSKPSWLSKHAYLKLAVLRSYPLRQLHRLATILSECRDMPFDHHVVQTMIRQTLYHLGPLVPRGSSSNGSICLSQEWRTQWDAAGGVLDALHSELHKLADELSNEPRAHDDVLLLGEVAAYLADWHAPCKEVAKQFAAMTSTHADVQLQDEVDKAAKAADEKVHTEMLAKQCKSRMMALLCYAAGPLEAADIGHMIELMVQIKHGDVYLGQVTGLQQQMAKLRALCHDAMCRRLRDIHKQVCNNQLTAAASSVLHTVPSGLSWRALKDSNAAITASYQAVGVDDQSCRHLYSINLLDGTILVDGFPPGRLPREVTEHPMYLRTFGRVDFEVFRTEQGVLVTTRAVNGRHYEFSLSTAGDTAGDAESSADELMIVEVGDKAQGERLQLLDVGEGDTCARWGEQLPVRLRQLHSHWLSRTHGTILLRPRAFLQHNTQYIIIPTAVANTEKSSYGCWHVPSHLQDKHWLQLLPHELPELYQHHLVLQHQPAHLLQVLSVFEDLQFIHAYKHAGQQHVTTGSAEGTPLMLFELPRFGLEFELHSNGVLVSRDFKGYCLHECQQLVSQAVDGSTHYTLPDFQQYLVLQRSPELSTGAVPGSGRSDMLVLVPAGQVQPVWSVARKVSVVTSNSSDAKLKFHTYEVHGRFQYLQASSIESRLQLAALYAATSLLLPEPVSQQSGVETAVQLVRQSWTNQPLQAVEARHLHSIWSLAGHLAPASRLLTYELEASSCQLQHLHVHNAALSASAAQPGLSCDAAAEYQQLAVSALPGGWSVTFRQRLTVVEEQRILQSSMGAGASTGSSFRWMRQHGMSLLDVPPCPVEAGCISATELQLESLVAKPSPSGINVPPYPLRCKAHDAVPLKQDMHKELQESWQAYHSSPEATELTPGAKKVVLELQPQVQHWRQQAEAYVLHQLCDIPAPAVGQAGSCFNLLRSSQLSPTPGGRDLLSCAIQPELIAQFNPFLSKSSTAALHECILIWAQLCVLEDRLERLMKLFAAGEHTYKAVIIRELLVERIWDPVQHPKWLVFEVEGQLQIRPDQYHHAQELLAHTKDSSDPGPITQLNMGEGKTRVILPMLALEWADQSCVVRLNFLSPLLSMSYQHLHNTLTASVLNVRLFTMPFHRDVQVTDKGAQAMLGALTYCQQVGGLLLVAPEHRLPFLLKSFEVFGTSDSSLFCWLQQLLALRYQDILDESDELLHHRLQLVYACGTPQPLPSLQERTIAIQALLRQVSDLVDAGTCPELSTEGVATWTPSANRPPGAFCGLQLLAGSGLDSIVPCLHKRLVEQLNKTPPHEMRWLAGLNRGKADLLSCATDPAASAIQTLSRRNSLFQVIHSQQDLEDQVLILRGLLACNLLQHTLMKRHRVNYGVSRLPTARKRLAVPFRAADTPSIRSEFAQPDVALLLTHLSYYYDGLTLEEFKAALDQLLLMGPSAQEDYYKQWLQLSQDWILPEHKPVFDAVHKIDPTHTQQLQLMHSYMSHNMAVVNFWLSFCVLPKETVQYPKRLVATSWNLADNADGRVVGFSGTNDNHRLLPLQVQQKALTNQPRLIGTNGKMLAMLSMQASYKTLRRPAATTHQADYKPDWQLLLDAALQEKGSAGQTGMEALLDCGALLAGIETRDAAQYILQHTPNRRYQGVCYFEPSQQQWTVADKVGRITPLSQSPVAEADCFVIYDDARCRGADLKLNQQAVGLLTLAPGMCKDKMMQAAGRMRQLGRGQTLLVVGLPDVTDKICEADGTTCQSGVGASEPSMLDVLQWVMNNTVQSTLQGVVEHATQGMQFAVTKGAPDRALLDEKLLLTDFYGNSKAKEPVARVLKAAADGTRQQLKVQGQTTDTSINSGACLEHLKMSDADRQELIQRVLHKGTAHGQGHLVLAGQSADEECERELEEEEEEEKEVEKEIPRVTAAAEVDWDYSATFAARAVFQLVHANPGTGFQVMSLRDVVPNLGPGFKDFTWSAKVHCTVNFVRACQNLPVSSDAGWGLYQQYLDTILVFHNGDALLVSEREAEGLQELVWAKSAVNRIGSQPPLLLSLSYAQQVMQSQGATPLLLACPLSSKPSLPSGLQLSPQNSANLLQQRLMQSEMVTMWFFNGGTSQYSAQQQHLLHQLVKGKREQAKDLLSARDQLAMLARSDLEKACDY